MKSLSRRDFLKGSLTAAGLTIASTFFRTKPQCQRGGKVFGPTAFLRLRLTTSTVSTPILKWPGVTAPSMIAGG
jgi:hypothetical protein